MAPSISRRRLFEVWMKNTKCSKVDSLIAFIMQEVETLSNSESAVISLKSRIKKICQTINSKWEKFGRHRQRFLRNYSSSLSGNVAFSDDLFKGIPFTVDPSLTNPGRPTKTFDACSSKAIKVHLLQ
ncbi:hypothetical protein AVEN_66747-1 [Araneus ventricosus]|uniref:Uncharacterized protein n=1 Tax=Araneus ventricosus TaxID=182803 RepID=A0A4Y2HS33_ARAVE|nr:hypothetical protein AVEN_66747-1 [Araneus ventricosus]